MNISRFILLAIAIVNSIDCFAQSQYCNNWYASEQQYIKITVAETGWYHCSVAQLMSAGFQVNHDSLSYLQLFRRGRESAIKIVRDEGNNFIGLEFYGEKNDGQLDSSLYSNPLFQPQNSLSLYSDTAAYFLTYGQYKGKRVLEIKMPDKSENPSQFLIREVSHIFTDEYTAGNIYPLGATYENGVILTTYDEGEGYCGPLIKQQQPQKVTIKCKDPERNSIEKFNVRLKFVGRGAGKHWIQITTGTQPLQTIAGELQWENYQVRELDLGFTSEDLNDSDEITLHWTLKGESNGVSLVAIEWNYPQSVDHLHTFDPDLFKINSEGLILKEALHPMRFIDVTDPYNCQELLVLNNITGSFRNVLAVKKPLQSYRLKKVKLSDEMLAQTEFLIITHPVLRHDGLSGLDPVVEYVAYRESPEGGGYKVSIVEIDEVFDWFHFGERSPKAIQNMIEYLTAFGHLQFVFIIGRSKDPQTVRFARNGWKDDLIPNAGWPGSDMALGMKSLNDPFPKVAIGRLFVEEPRTITAYLDKVKLFESESGTALWRKNVLHLSGGQSTAEREIFRSYTDLFSEKVTESTAGFNIRTLSKRTNAVTESIDISEWINEGIALVTTFGHSSLNQIDLDFGKISNTGNMYKNRPAFPAFWVNGCASGNMYFRGITLSTDWVNEPDKGSLLFVAHSHNGATQGLKRYTDAFYETLADLQFISQPFGLIMKEAASRYLKRFPWLTDIITVQQMNLQGDPAIKIFPATKPDLQFGQGKPSVTYQSDGLVVKSHLLNAGRYWKGNYVTQLSVSQDGVVFYNAELSQKSFSMNDSIRFVIPVTALKNNRPIKIELMLDADENIEEESELNNHAELLIDPLEIIPFVISEMKFGPNPFTHNTTFHLHVFGKSESVQSRIEIYDVIGNRIDVLTQDLIIGENQMVWNPVGIVAGIYLYKLSVESRNKLSDQPKKLYYRSGKLIALF